MVGEMIIILRVVSNSEVVRQTPWRLPDDIIQSSNSVLSRHIQMEWSPCEIGGMILFITEFLVDFFERK